MVEHAAVNRRVVGSSPTEGATKGVPPPQGGGTFLYKVAKENRSQGPLAQLVRADGS